MQAGAHICSPPPPHATCYFLENRSQGSSISISPAIANLTLLTVIVLSIGDGDIFQVHLPILQLISRVGHGWHIQTRHGGTVLIGLGYK